MWPFPLHSFCLLVANLAIHNYVIARQEKVTEAKEQNIMCTIYRQLNTLPEKILTFGYNINK